jgi:hypothetical protein
MANISVRGLDEQALRRLRQAASRRGVSLNRLIADLLNGIARGKPPVPAEHPDLDALAGTWTAADAREFERAAATFGHVDEDLWR